MNRIVIATDSAYVCEGATQHIKAWERNGWQTARKQPVKNRDLWELLIRGVRKQARLGVDVVFWKIPREQNWEADAAAKKAALEGEKSEYFLKFSGVMQGEYLMASEMRPWDLINVDDVGMIAPIDHSLDVQGVEDYAWIVATVETAVEYVSFV